MRAPQVHELGAVLLRDVGRVPAVPYVVEQADAAGVAAYRALRRAEFVEQQGLFETTDLDHLDDDPRLVVLVARDRAGTVLGGVRLGPVHTPDIGWWQGSRLVTRPGGAGAVRGVGAALVRAACARAEAEGALRFDATVQHRYRAFFERIGWRWTGSSMLRSASGAPAEHDEMRWPIGRVAALVAATKRDLGGLLDGLGPLGGPGFVGDDGAPVPGAGPASGGDLVAACDAILPSMVERDPEWAGWCAVLVNVNDLAAMGATPVALLDALGAKDAAAAARVLRGLRRASAAFGAPVIGGHTQLGVPAALSVTALGRAEHLVPGGGARVGHVLRLTADLGGSWRAGYGGRQWDSSSGRSAEELQAMLRSVGTARPSAAKDVSMAGIAGTAGMLAEASGCGVVLDVASVPRPAGATAGDWFTCFPGFAVLTADAPGAPGLPAGPATGAECGELVAGAGVRLRWPDGATTTVLHGPATGLGPATGPAPATRPAGPASREHPEEES